jgi:cyclopropane fatty-acyl-phospholipid synthase-like methyltransferase
MPTDDLPPRVPEAYDRIAERWRADRLATSGLRERRFVDRLIEPLRPGARVLDVGCGCGAPIAAYLAGRGMQVTGLDGSARLLRYARELLPGATFVHGDMRTAEAGGGYDAVVAWDSVFHVPRGDHAALFGRFRSWLRPGGRLLLSLGGSGDEGFTSEMHGEAFFYSGHEPAEALGLLEAAGLAVEHWEVDDPSSRGHIAVLAARRG